MVEEGDHLRDFSHDQHDYCFGKCKNFLFALICVLNSSSIPLLRPYQKILSSFGLQHQYLYSLLSRFSWKIHSIPIFATSFPSSFSIILTACEESLQHLLLKSAFIIAMGVPEPINMPTEYFIKTLRCFSYIMKFSFTRSDKVNHIEWVVINIG